MDGLVAAGLLVLAAVAGVAWKRRRRSLLATIDASIGKTVTVELGGGWRQMHVREARATLVERRGQLVHLDFGGAPPFRLTTRDDGWVHVGQLHSVDAG